MRIDIHTHFQCLDFVKHLRGRSALPKTILDGGSYVIQCAGLNMPCVPKAVDVEQKLRDMDDMKVDVAALSHGIPFGPDLLGGREADDWAERINDDLARIISMYPSRFVGLGSIGFGNCHRSIAEVNRCVNELGFSGFQVFSNISGELIDSPEVMPVLKHIGALGVPVHLHPAIPVNRIGFDTASELISLGFPFDSSLNTMRLIRSGLLDESINLKLIVSHIGGVIPYLSGRIATYNGPSPVASQNPNLERPVTNYLKRLYVDTVCYHLEALECCYKVMGAGHMLYGTDHPFGHYQLASELIERLDCPESDRELIWHGNAERVMNLKASPSWGATNPGDAAVRGIAQCAPGR